MNLIVHAALNRIPFPCRWRGPCQQLSYMAQWTLPTVSCLHIGLFNLPRYHMATASLFHSSLLGAHFHVMQVEAAIVSQLGGGQAWMASNANNVLLSITCLLSNVLQEVQEVKKVQLLNAVRTVPDGSAIAVCSSTRGPSKEKYKRRQKGLHKYQKRMCVHVIPETGSAEHVELGQGVSEQDEAMQDADDAENQPPPTQVVSRAQQAAHSSHLHAPSTLTTLCQRSDGLLTATTATPATLAALAPAPATTPATMPAPVPAATVSAAGPAAPPAAMPAPVPAATAPAAGPAGQHWDVTYEIHPYWATTYPGQPSWKLIVPGHPKGQKEPWASWEAKRKSLGGKTTVALLLCAY
jgi:hypothetical protein